MNDTTTMHLAPDSVRPVPRRTPRHPRRGISVVFIVLFLAILIGFVALAVDTGRVWLARAQMQTVADAAARAAALTLPRSNSSTDVTDIAGEAALENPVIDADRTDPDHPDGRTNPGVTLEVDDDVIFGTWAKNAEGDMAFTPIDDAGGTDTDARRRANAVRVIGRRNQARDNGLPLVFAPVLRIFDGDMALSSNVERDAIAHVSGGPSRFGFVGIDSVRANGNNVTVDSMVNGRTGIGGGVASDGDITLNNSDIYGDARPGIGKDVIQGPNSVVTGWMADLDYKLADRYPPETYNATGPYTGTITPANAVNGRNFQVTGNSNVSVGPGRYNFNRWNMSGNGTVTITGPATIFIDTNYEQGGSRNLVIAANSTGPVVFWVNGNFLQTGGTIANTGSPSNLQIHVTKAGSSVDVGGGPNTRAQIYAPLSSVKVHGNTGFYGWIIGKSLLLDGTIGLHYDETRNVPGDYEIRLVE